MSTQSHSGRRIRIAVSVAGVLSLLISCDLLAQDGAWTTKAPMPAPRAQMAVAVANGQLYVVGGVSGPTFFSLSIVGSLEMYDPKTDTWFSKPPMATRRNDPAAGSIDGILYVVGGLAPPTPTNPVPQFLSSMEAYDPKTNTWSNRAPMPTPRQSHLVAAARGILYAVGGYTVRDGPGGATPEVLSVVEAYNPDTNTWTAKTPMPTRRSGAAAGVVDGILYIVGGGTNVGGEQFLPTLEAYDPSTNTWTTKAPMPTPRCCMAAGVVDGVLYVAGGIGPSTASSRTLDTLEAYDPKTDTWTASPPLPTPRSSLAGGVANDVLYLVGGYDSNPEILRLNEAFSPFLHVGIDIKPGDAKNTINLKSLGVVPVAILGSAKFDPLTVEPETVTLAGAPVATRGRGVPMTYQGDFNRDGYLDLLLYFRTQDLKLAPGATEAVLYGETTTGQRIRGSDSLRIVPSAPTRSNFPAPLDRPRPSSARLQ